MALGSRLNVSYGDSRFLGGAAGVARKSPQHFIVGLLRRDVLDVTRTRRAAELNVIPKRTRSYLGPHKPGVAQRIPPMLPEPQNYAKVRDTLVARSRLLRTVESKGQRA